MLEWKRKTGDEKLRAELERTKLTFDSWFDRHWAARITRDRMLGENSPVAHVAAKMTKTFEEVKELYPLEAKEECSMCEQYVDEWIETEFSFCGEYGCGMSLCIECAEKIGELAK